MKFCILQYMFIAAILSISSALYPNPLDNARRDLEMMKDKLELAAKDLRDLLEADIARIDRNDKAAAVYDHKDSKLSPKKRSVVRTVQSEALKAKNDAESSVQHIKQNLGNLTDAIASARKRASNHNHRMEDSLKELKS